MLFSEALDRLDRLSAAESALSKRLQEELRRIVNEQTAVCVTFIIKHHSFRFGVFIVRYY